MDEEKSTFPGSQEAQSATYQIIGTPVPLARARFNSQKTCWNSQKELVLVWGITLKKQHGQRPLFNGPLHIDLKFYFKMPKGKIKQWTTINGSPYPHKPDIDNLIKWVLDAASKNVLYADDAIICSITSTKIYGFEPKTIFTISELNG